MIKSVVITGATGTIGCALAEYLAGKDMIVYAICRPKSKRLEAIKGKANIQIIEMDLSELEELPQMINENVDVFYHLGWTGTNRQDRDNGLLQARNVEYTLHAVYAAKQLGCSTFIGAGSQAEYGRVEGIIGSNEKANPISAYGITKLCAGQLSRRVCEQLHINHIWTRIFSVYGPYTGEDSVLISSAMDLLSGKKPLCTEGLQVWDFLYSHDAAKALFLLAKKGISGKIYCIGSGKGMTIRRSISILRDSINPNASIGFGEISYPPHPVMELVADITELCEDTGFCPDYTFQEGIQETVEWLKQRIS